MKIKESAFNEESQEGRNRIHWQPFSEWKQPFILEWLAKNPGKALTDEDLSMEWQAVLSKPGNESKQVDGQWCLKTLFGQLEDDVTWTGLRE